MGCDIYAFVESKECDRYWTQANPHLTRNYLMFGIMAGVRNPGVALYEPKGLPDDMYHSTRYAYQEMQPDAHTMSWLSVEEFEKVVVRYEEDGRWGSSPLIYKATLAFMQELDSARLVFWFTN